jgi:integrase
MVGCGLRRAELASFTLEHLQLRCGQWVIVDIRGKHGRVRSVPVPDWAKALVDAWVRAAGVTSGRVFRAVDKKSRVHGDGLTAQSIYDIIRGSGIEVGLAVAPHDLRRSFARLAHAGHSPLEQIQMSLGHASVATTERYIGARQNLKDAPCDRVGIYLPLTVRIEEDIDELWRRPSGSGNRSVLRATGFMPVYAAARAHEESSHWF